MDLFCRGEAWEIREGEAVNVLEGLPDGAADCILTSPPYWNLRDYGVEGQAGREATAEAYLDRLVGIYNAARRVLVRRGSLLIIIGDSRQAKALLGLPWRLALRLARDGWLLRQEIIWHKTNPSPEPVGDRCTLAHEHVFHLTRQRQYFWDAAAIYDPYLGTGHYRVARLRPEDVPGSKRANSWRRSRQPVEATGRTGRNRRTVWTCGTGGTDGHPAAMPLPLARDLVRAACPPGGTVLDFFAGSGTTGVAAIKEGRRAILSDLSPDYCAGMRQRMEGRAAK